MRPFALFYVWYHRPTRSPAIYFLLFSELRGDGAVGANLPPPFQLGPFLFGKNRVSLLTFGPRELRIERLSAPNDHRAFRFRLSRDTETVELNPQTRPAAFYNLVLHRFESSRAALEARRAQLSLLTKLSFENLLNVDPELLWIKSQEVRLNILYACNNSGQVSDDTFARVLRECAPYVGTLLDNDPQRRSDRGDFEEVVGRSRIIFGVLAEYSYSTLMWTSASSDTNSPITMLLPVASAFPRRVSERLPSNESQGRHLPWLPAVGFTHRLPSATTSWVAGSPAAGSIQHRPSLTSLGLDGSVKSSGTFDILLSPVPPCRAYHTLASTDALQAQRTPLTRKFASLGPRDCDDSLVSFDGQSSPLLVQTPPSNRDIWQGIQTPLSYLKRKTPTSPTDLSAASTTEESGLAVRVEISTSDRDDIFT